MPCTWNVAVIGVIGMINFSKEEMRRNTMRLRSYEPWMACTWKVAVIGVSLQLPSITCASRDCASALNQRDQGLYASSQQDLRDSEERESGGKSTRVGVENGKRR